MLKAKLRVFWISRENIDVRTGSPSVEDENQERTASPFSKLLEFHRQP